MTVNHIEGDNVDPKLIAEVEHVCRTMHTTLNDTAGPTWEGLNDPQILGRSIISSMLINVIAAVAQQVPEFRMSLEELVHIVNGVVMVSANHRVLGFVTMCEHGLVHEIGQKLEQMLDDMEVNADEEVPGGLDKGSLN